MVALLSLCGTAASVRAQPAPLSESVPQPDAALAASATELEPATASKLPSTLEADVLEGRPDVEAVAKGNVDFRQGSKRIQADRLSYTQQTDVVRAVGHVNLSSEGNWFSGPELQLTVGTYEGFFLEPTYFIARTKAGGTAERWDFMGRKRAAATHITYTSCPLDGSGTPAWLMSADSMQLDFENNEGIAEGAVLRFYGVPILGAPKISFPLSDARKSGWLPFSTNADSKGGFEVVAPYYWNIAPNRDAKLSPVVSAKRGLGLLTDFRYLEPSFEGRLMLHWLPRDEVIGRQRDGINFAHKGVLFNDVRYHARSIRVSDDDYWKDFSRYLTSLTPRLLDTDVGIAQDHGRWSTYASVKRWQVLQDANPAALIDAPYDRLPQVGARTVQPLGGGFQLGLEGEYNRFANPDGYQLVPVSALAGSLASSRPRPTGSRTHALGSVSWPVITPGWTLVPKLSLNMASYALEQPLLTGAKAGRTRFSRAIPSLSLDSAWTLERDAQWFGRDVRQTLEPRVLYVKTPYRAQAGLPNFDSAPKDFNVDSIYTDNEFSGIDRVSDANQLTAGVTTRLLNRTTGAESLRIGIAQRVLFQEQRVRPDDGPPAKQSLSDVLLFGSSNLWRRWFLDSAVQYSYENSRMTRSVLGARYSPGPYRTVGLTYRLKQGESEQVDLTWQWPLYGPARSAKRSDTSCQGSWYSAGRVNYSLRESRVTDSVVALEYDSGCWVGRLMAKRLSTGQSEATTQFGVQIEFVGLSRLGTINAVKALKDNVPGYLPLRREYDDSAAQ